VVDNLKNFFKIKPYDFISDAPIIKEMIRSETFIEILSTKDLDQISKENMIEKEIKNIEFLENQSFSNSYDKNSKDSSITFEKRDKGEKGEYTIIKKENMKSNVISEFYSNKNFSNFRHNSPMCDGSNSNEKEKELQVKELDSVTNNLCDKFNSANNNCNN